MPWQLCSASVKPAGTIQVFLENSKTTPENSIKFKTEVIFIKICCKAYNHGSTTAPDTSLFGVGMPLRGINGVVPALIVTVPWTPWMQMPCLSQKGMNHPKKLD